MLIYLADLSHTGQVVASNVFPLGIGLVGANIMKEIPDARVELFKYPADLAAALERETPDVAGFSCYSWNTYLAMEFAQRIKVERPETAVIAGGPNYEPADFWGQFEMSVDFFVYREGELATLEIIRRAEKYKNGRRVASIKAAGPMPSVHWMKYKSVYPRSDIVICEGIVQNDLAPRVKDLDLLPSPYTAGLMDKFFDGVLIPLVHTTRGCPFSCSFCQEGHGYYSKVAKRHTLSEDLQYIAPRVGSVQDLYFSDANVGMFKEDADKARAIAQVQARYGWPQYIHCSGGKNHKERVLEFAEIVGGRMGVSASLQTTDAQVLRNIKRENISVEQLVDVARRGSRIDANTYAEIILNLPGDTVAAHTRSLRDAVNSGVSYLRMYQLILLPDTEMNTPAQRAQYGMHTAWRIMPRCFGTYTYRGESFAAAEVEEIVTAQDSLSFEEYLDCRELALTIELVHNSGLFRELWGLCALAGVEWFSLLLGFHAVRRRYLPELYDDFRRRSVEPLFATRDEALDFASAHLDLYLTEQIGTNELFNAKARGFFTLQEELHEGMYREAGVSLAVFADYLEEARAFSLARKRNLLEDAPERSQRFSYDFPALAQVDFAEDPRLHRRDVDISFGHSAGQRATIDQFVNQYGTSETGLGRIMLRAHLKKLFREMHYEGNVSAAGFDSTVRRASNLQD